MPISSAIAKSVSESPPRTASAPRMNIAPRPVFTVRGTVCSDRGVHHPREAPAAVRPPQLPHPVEHDDGVVHRVADDGQQGGQEDTVDRLAQPGEDADQHQRRRAPSRRRRPRRASSGTGSPGRRAAPAGRPRGRSAPCCRSSSPRLGPISSSRSLVTSPPAASASAARIVGLLVVGHLPGADREVVRTALLDHGAREAGVRDCLAGLVDRQLRATSSTPPADRR